ncbi:3-hydroxyacyl-CoA dehydrogenase family protein [Allosalinactinospora lopnorensis]|uniref:3-hydroxyacyl-CoA dehydrogenase family protein n=1 Tax=Allosalinactinospora lopnorensis TaxID=1352348 RepID=UPI000623BB04|nr:3-hydroxyacyl-CoA dehydrogenase family protein [Allosalinactinospora lopnorensis]
MTRPADNDGGGTPHRLAVLGAGVMGTGITALALGCGLPVVLVDVDKEALERSRDRVRTHLRFAQMTGKLPPGGEQAGFETTTSVADISGCTAVVEAVTERAEVKSQVWSEVAATVPPGTLLVSNTSAVPIGEQAASVRHPEDLIGVHFMNPPYMIHTAEIVRGPSTGDTTVAATRALLGALGRHGIVVADAPGFVINRVLQWTINEAARIVEEGIAAPEDVDALFKGCLGHTTGPLATADLIGLDNVVDSLRVLRERLDNDRYEPCDALVAKVTAGDLGRKTGRGFFDYGGTAS